MSCTNVAPRTLAVLDDLAVASSPARSADAVATRLGEDLGAVVGVLDELAAIGWVFGGPDDWQLTGVGHSHTSHTSPPGLLGGGN